MKLCRQDLDTVISIIEEVPHELQEAYLNLVVEEIDGTTDESVFELFTQIKNRMVEDARKIVEKRRKELDELTRQKLQLEIIIDEKNRRN